MPMSATTRRKRADEALAERYERAAAALSRLHALAEVETKVLREELGLGQITMDVNAMRSKIGSYQGRLEELARRHRAAS